MPCVLFSWSLRIIKLSHDNCCHEVMHIIGIWHNFRMNSQMIQNAENNIDIAPYAITNQYQAQNGISPAHIIILPVCCVVIILFQFCRRNGICYWNCVFWNVCRFVNVKPSIYRSQQTFLQTVFTAHRYQSHSSGSPFITYPLGWVTQPIMICYFVWNEIVSILLEAAGMSKSLRKMCPVQCQFHLFSMMKSIRLIILTDFLRRLIRLRCDQHLI